MSIIFQAGGGKENVVQAKEGFIGAGQSNCIVTGSNYGFIGSGVGNCISTGSGYYGVIGGGSFNTVSAQYGSILGGKGNKVTHKYASASGYNVSSVMDCAFHANNFVGQNLPTVAGPAGSGIFWKQAALGGWVVMIS